MSALEKLKTFKDKKDKYYFKAKDYSHIDIEYVDKSLKFKLHKWGKEASVEVSLPMVEADTHTFIENKIEIEDSKKKIRVYPIDTRSTGDFYGDSDDIIQCHDGGLRYDIKYFEMPPTNFFDTPLMCRNTRWTKQPFLTQEEMDRIIRPLNVEGSYAVYHTTKKHNQYTTGKIVHVYRPIAEDALGNKAWCDIEVDRPIDPTNMRVTIPQQFLDEAIYPVTIDPDFGETGIGGSQGAIATSTVAVRVGSAWTMPAPGGTANYMRAYLNGETDVTCDCKILINQKDSGGAGTHGQIAGPVENLDCVEAAHWEEFTLGGELLTQGVVYILNILGNPDDLSVKGNDYQCAFDVDGAVDSYLDGIGNYPAPDNPFVDNPEGTTWDYSIFVNYSVAGWSGKIAGVTDPAAIAGVAKADIAEVKSVA